MYSKACLKRSLKKTKIGFQDRLSLDAGKKYCRMFTSEIHSSFIKRPFDFKAYVLSILSGLLGQDLLYAVAPTTSICQLRKATWRRCIAGVPVENN